MSQARSYRAENFNPRSSCEERRWSDVGRAYIRANFNPRSSCEERLATTSCMAAAVSNFNPRSSCEERRRRRGGTQCHPAISIHAPHARSDSASSGARRHTAFQSTLLMRGATISRQTHYYWLKISIHAPHARSDTCQPGRSHRHQSYFNPRSSCEERLKPPMLTTAENIFQSTLLMRGATNIDW